MHPATKFLLLHVLAASAFVTSNALQLRSAGARGGAAGASCIPHEREALLAFKRGISRDPMDILASWQKDGQGDCCRWKGVRCSNRTGHVLKLQLRNVHVTSSNFYNEDVFNSTALVGQISHSLLSMDHLVYLDFSMNYLISSSSRIPAFLGSFTNLRYLNLSGRPFYGRVPPHLGNLSKLQYLDLSRGQYLFSTDISWLAGLSKLEYLAMRWVNLSTIVDWADVVNMNPSLKVLDLSGCSLISANHYSLPHINLTNLGKLDLSGNIFVHPMVFTWFWNLTGLQYLNLAGTNLSGNVPNTGILTTSLNVLCNLTFLDLSWSHFDGNLKELIGWMLKCPSIKLKELHLGDNNITGIITSQIAHLTSLVVLDISSNYLTGGIPPGVGKLSSLSTLDLSDNYLSGHVPSEIGMLTSLIDLDLRSNKLDGEITEKHFMKLAKLKWLALSGNSLKIRVSSEWLPPFRLEETALADCQIGPLFPAWLRFQVNIHWVDISSTGLIDKLPSWFSTTFSKATYLDISNNQINGTLPKNMEFMSLEWLYLSSNELTGQIPFLPKNLSMLDLSLNSLSGNLSLISRTPKLVSLNLFSNHITGDISGSICELRSLSELDLGNNLFEGELPPCFPARTLEFLLLGNNSFSGNFPLVLQNCSQLLFLDLSRNKFSGKLPYWIGGLVGLRFLRLSQNMFSGNISSSITNLTHLHHLNLANNRLSGVIPWGLSNLTAMTGDYVMDPYLDTEPYGGYYELVRETGQYFSAVTKGQELYYDIRIFEMVSIDLSFNHLSCAIPEEIVYLDALSNLDLSWNHLSGEVPDKIGFMKSLESLDLSKNALSGEIPSSISNLSYLSYLDLSDNNLTGRIPSGRQLDTLYTEHPSMYSGNSGLCGPPLKKMCSGNNASTQDVHKRSQHDFETMSFYFGLGFGFMMGLWVVFCILLLKRTWSIAYFRLIDRIYNQMYVAVFITWKSLAGEGSTD